jgi:hypothetical protein
MEGYAPVTRRTAAIIMLPMAAAVSLAAVWSASDHFAGARKMVAQSEEGHLVVTPDTGWHFEITIGGGPADVNWDGVVDWRDVETMRYCRSGPMVPYKFGCSKADIDKDGDVDQDDFALLQEALR